MKAQGTYQELQKSGIDISAFVPASSDDDIELAEEDEVDEETSVKSSWKDTTKKLATDTAEEKFDPATELGPASKDEESEALVGISGGTDNGGSVLSRQQSANIEDVVELSKEAELAASERKLDRRSSQIMSIEEKNTGDVTTSVYSYYIRSGGVWLFCLVLLGLTASQGAAIAAQFQLAAWGSKSATDSANGSPLSSQQNLDQLVRNLMLFVVLDLLSYLLVFYIYFSYHSKLLLG